MYFIACDISSTGSHVYFRELVYSSLIRSHASLVFHRAERSAIGVFPFADLGGVCKAALGDIGGNGGTGGGVLVRAASLLRLLELEDVSMSKRPYI